MAKKKSAKKLSGNPNDVPDGPETEPVDPVEVDSAVAAAVQEAAEEAEAAEVEAVAEAAPVPEAAPEVRYRAFSAPAAAPRSQPRSALEAVLLPLEILETLCLSLLFGGSKRR